MALLSTQKWKRIGIIAAALVSVGTIIWSTVSFANTHIEKVANNQIIEVVPELINEKIEIHAEETVKEISLGLTSIQAQMFDMQERLIKSDIRNLTQNKSVNQLTAGEKSQFEYLMQEQKIIQEDKRKLLKKKPN